MLQDLTVRNLQCSYYFCNFVNILAIWSLFLEFSYHFCNLVNSVAFQSILQFSVTIIEAFLEKKKLIVKKKTNLT